MTDWSAKQMIGDRGQRIKWRLGRVRAYKRVGMLEARAAALLTETIALREVRSRTLTDGEITEMRRQARVEEQRQLREKQLKERRGY